MEHPLKSLIKNKYFIYMNIYLIVCLIIGYTDGIFDIVELVIFILASLIVVCFNVIIYLNMLEKWKKEKLGQEQNTTILKEN